MSLARGRAGHYERVATVELAMWLIGGVWERIIEVDDVVVVDLDD